MGRLTCWGHGAALRWSGTIGGGGSAVISGGGRSGGGTYVRSCGCWRGFHPSPAHPFVPSEMRSVTRRLGNSSSRGTGCSLPSPTCRPSAVDKVSTLAGLKSVTCLRYSVVPHRASAPALVGCVGTRCFIPAVTSVVGCGSGGWYFLGSWTVKSSVTGAARPGTIRVCVVLYRPFAMDAATALASAMADPSLNGAMELSLTCRGLTRRGDRSWPAKLPSFFGPAASSI